jgi:GT2 family glycosyltransferase
LGAVLIQDGELEAGIAAFIAGLKQDPDNVTLLSSIGVAHLYLNDFVSAQRYAARALRIDPNNVDSMLCRAREELMLGNVHLADMYIDNLGRTGYKRHEVLLLQVDIQSRKGEHEAAVVTAAELCEQYPASYECLSSFRRAFRAFHNAQARYKSFLATLDIPWFPATTMQHGPVADAVKIDVIIPIHNSLRQVMACLQTVLAHSGARLGKLILVNDDSAAETVAALSAFCDARAETVLVHTQRRSGFTSAVLCGLAQSDAPAFVVLNSDTLVPHGWLDKLYVGLRSGAKTAMVSPMSNNAAWQNYGPVFADDGRLCTPPIPDQRERERLENLSHAFGQAALAPLPILHGFCILVDRVAFDDVGGFDLRSYPEGYGETQDLSLRLISAGFDLFVVTNCIVFHERGGSISERRRHTLTLSAREKLYQKHSALNYLCLEMACCQDLLLKDLRKSYARTA